MTVETDTIKSSRESPSKAKRKRPSRSSSSGSSSSGSTSSSSASSRSSSSSSSNSSSSSSRSSSAASSPEKNADRNTNKIKVNNKPPPKKPLDITSSDDKKNGSTINKTRRAPSPIPPHRQEKEKEATRIYVAKLSSNVTKEHLAEIFGTFGEVKDIDLPAHRIHPHLHRGFAHIEYVSPTGAEQACKYMEGGQVDGKEIVCALVHGQPSHLSGDRNRRETSPYGRRRQRSPQPPSRHYPPPRRGGDRDRDRDRDRERGRYGDRRGGHSPPSRNYRRGQSPTTSNRRIGGSGNMVESPKRKERRYSRSSSSESK